MAETPSYAVEITDSLNNVPAEDWDRLVGDHNPFVEHAFLQTLEEAGCVGEESGWIPRYLLVREEGTGRLVGAAPSYAKTNSHGEYIFDWGWAEAAQRGGIPYYPKLTVAVPFTPATGPRLLRHPDLSDEQCVAVTETLAKGALAVAKKLKLWSVHWLFTSEDEAKALASHGYDHRLSYQFHWTNRGYADFDAFLADLRSKRRKEVRRERRRASACGLEIGLEKGSDLSADDWRALYQCYRSTIDDRWAIPYLNPTWFELLGPRLGHRALVATVRREGALVGGALAFHKGEHIYGRYWGCLEDHDALHFECCYYQLIAYAIQHGCTRVEAGAQGHHKLARGFLPTVTHSAHWLRHPGLAEAVGDFIAREAEGVRAQVQDLAGSTPFAGER